MGCWRDLVHRRTWLRINSAIRKHDWGIALLRAAKFKWPWWAVRSEMVKEAEDRRAEEEGAISSCDVTYSVHRAQCRESPAMIHRDSPLASLNPLQIALLLPQHLSLCANSVAIGGTAAKRGWVVERNVFLINHRGAFKISVRCSGEYFFLRSLREHLKHTQLDC